MHVRMGDRREYQDGSLDYFNLLNQFMDTFSREAAGKGLERPMFHIFSETVQPCPSRETGLFDEFPLWPAELDQVRDVVVSTACLFPFSFVFVFVLSLLELSVGYY